MRLFEIIWKISVFSDIWYYDISCRTK